jgi:hypothetical protein
VGEVTRRRFIGAWGLTVAICSLIIVWWNFPPKLTPLRRVDIEFSLWIALLACATSFVAVWMLARLPYFAPALVVTVLNGFVLAYLVGTITYGDDGEEMHGLLIRATGGAFIGVIATISAWSMQRWARRRLA